MTLKHALLVWIELLEELMRWWAERTWNTKFVASSAMALLLLLGLHASGLEWGNRDVDQIFRASESAFNASLLLPFMCGLIFLYLRNAPELLAVVFVTILASCSAVANHFWYQWGMFHGQTMWQPTFDALFLAGISFFFGLSANIFYHYAVVYFIRICRPLRMR